VKTSRKRCREFVELLFGVKDQTHR
jgi:hypothetical protein